MRKSTEPKMRNCGDKTKEDKRTLKKSKMVQETNGTLKKRRSVVLSSTTSRLPRGLFCEPRKGGASGSGSSVWAPVATAAMRGAVRG
jgi:hypothetical protein